MQTAFIKPTRTSVSQVELTPEHVERNRINGVATSLLLDSSVVIRMEKAMKIPAYSNIDEEHELWSLITLLRECNNAISVSPGFAFSEMPPVAATKSVELFNAFFQKYLPMYSNAPGSILKDFQEEAELTEKSHKYLYEDLSRSTRSTLGLSYASLLYLNQIEHGVDSAPLNKYIRYLFTVKNNIPLISAKEAEIARFCLSPPTNGIGELSETRKKIRNNFVKGKSESTGRNDKPPRTVSEIKAIALNGARDLVLITAANFNDTFGIDGGAQDCWIATHDFKLAEFASVFHHIKVDGVSGKGIVLSSLPEQDSHEYWAQTKNEFIRLNASRKSIIENKKIKVRDIRRAVELARQRASTTFTIHVGP